MTFPAPTAARPVSSSGAGTELEGLRLAVRQAPKDPALRAALGDALAVAGRDRDAEKAYREALRLDPRPMATKVKFAGTLVRLGRGQEAERHLVKLLSGPEKELPPPAVAELASELLAEAWSSGGEPALRKGLVRLQESVSTPLPLLWIAERFVARRAYAVATEACNLALDRWPTSAVGFARLAAVLYEAKDLDNAALAARRAVELDVSRIDARLTMTLSLIARSDYAEAERVLQEALLLDPRNVEVLGQYGNLLYGLARNAEALVLLERAVEIQPAMADLHSLRATVLGKLGREAEGVAAAEEAVRLAPRDPRQHIVKAECLLLLDRHDEADSAIADALAVGGRNGRALMLRSRIQAERGDLDAALAVALEAVECEPETALVWNGLGNLRVHRREYAQALEAYETASRYGILSPQALYNRAFALLAMGRIAEGWDHYEVGVHAHIRNAWRRTTRPFWDGEPLAGRSLGIVAEQGIGDQILFLSCLPDFLRQIGPEARVVVEVNPKLLRLVQRSFPSLEVRAAERRPGRDRIEDFDDFDTALLMGSLPRAVRRSLDDFPAESVGFLKPDPERVAHWRRILAARGPQPAIGLCWRSMLRQTRRNLSYVALEEMAPLFELAGLQFVSLQYGGAREELAAAEANWPGRVLSLEDEVDLTDDLDEVAAVMSALDAVVAPSTSVSSLGGALGVPTYEFSHNNWLRMGTDRIPCYPSIRCFEYPRDVPIAESIPEIRAALLRDFALEETGA